MTRSITMRSLALLVFATLIWARPGGAQRSDRDRRRAEAEENDRDNDDGAGIDTTVPFASSGGVVDLSIVSGQITVTGWTRSEARIHASSDNDVPVRFEHGPDRILIDARHGRRWRDGGDVQLDISVPVGTRVIMHSTDGELHAHGTKGDIDARSVSGDVIVDDVVRSATLESVSGNVQARGVAGDVRARSVSGDVDLDQVSGDVTLSSVSGHGFVTSSKSRAVRMETVSGDLSYAGAFDAAGTYDFRSHSANIELHLPTDAGALLSIDTFSGDVQTDFPLTIQPRSDEARGPEHHHIETTLGHGGAHVTVSTFSGDVEIRRGNSRTHAE